MRRRPGMGDDEFVGGENGEGKRLVVFFWLWICGEAGRGLVWSGPGGGLLRCGAVRVRPKGRAAGLDTREGSRGASRGGRDGKRFF